MKITLCQINPILGDFAYNSALILKYLERAEGSDLVIFPECALMGYHPVDLLERSAVVQAQVRELKSLARKIPKYMSVILGAILPNRSPRGKHFQNSAVLIEHRKIRREFAKQLLPTYDVFDEARHIEPGLTLNNLVKIKDRKVLVTICEDIWAWPLPKQKPIYDSNPLLSVPKKKVDFVINLSASPFTKRKYQNRKHVVSQTAKNFKSPMVYCNMVGAQDELVFDGRSLVVNADGRLLHELKAFKEDMLTFDLAEPQTPVAWKPLAATESLLQAVVLGIQDFVRKTGFAKAHLGVSGGIDSAVVLELLCRALGAENVTAIALPGPFSSPESLQWAKQHCEKLGVKCLTQPITEIFNEVVKELNSNWGQKEFSVAEENLQARLRGLILMAFANREKSLLINTSNKSEFAVGYTTLYGDLCGALCPIGDLLKTEVYDLARHLKALDGQIPEEVILRPPSAELRPEQRDSDSLPPYSELDPIVEKLVENYASPKNATEKRILSLLMNSEFKRWQAPPILKLSEHSFGRGRRLPLAHRAWF